MHKALDTVTFLYTLELIFMEKPDWADRLEAKGALQISKCIYTTWKLYQGARVKESMQWNTCASTNTTTQGEGIQRYNGLMQTANRVNNLPSGSGHDCFRHAHILSAI